MAKDKAAASAGNFVQELAQTGRYKRSQGRTARQATMLAIWALVGVAGWQLFDVLRNQGQERWLQVGLPALVVIAGFWIAYRVINWPVFADFLIAVEAEMNKVTWPTRAELIRASAVVILFVFALAAVLFAYDVFWQYVLKHWIAFLRYAFS
ncbi:preprotein translocase subunit SecE [Blastopirellula retiformator]|uniref:Protein translocase subunit SecE n=1 Tax=Blastopirellula retiformator TaxID=2527970 RepID=A0A5C5V5V1_9BACT|nr:preprotein translocase subunit SecE [Blastopirellula retiformator]TWT33132.1 preprotein translocase subunit SecE [Blastopirellula retiformator]